MVQSEAKISIELLNIIDLVLWLTLHEENGILKL